MVKKNISPINKGIGAFGNTRTVIRKKVNKISLINDKTKDILATDVALKVMIEISNSKWPCQWDEFFNNNNIIKERDMQRNIHFQAVQSIYILKTNVAHSW